MGCSSLISRRNNKRVEGRCGMYFILNVWGDLEYIYISIQQIAVEKAKCDDFLIIKETHTEQMTKPQLDC